jgi:hypothetical protein
LVTKRLLDRIFHESLTLSVRAFQTPFRIDDDDPCATISCLTRSDRSPVGDRAPEANLESQKLRCYKKGMTTQLSSHADLSDQQLVARVKRLAKLERQSTASLICALIEFDGRRLYLGEGCSSLFTYCTQVLRLSEHAAYGRIEAARAGRHFPMILDLLCEGSVTLTTITLLGPLLTAENHREVLDSARHKSKREVEQIVAMLRPQPDASSLVRKLPQARRLEQASNALATSALAGTSPDRLSVPPARLMVPLPAVKPLAPERYKIQFTVSRETYDNLRRAQDLLRHSIPNGDLAMVFDRALALLVGHLEKSKLAATTRPRNSGRGTTASRHVPASVRRQVWSRDEGRCAFVGPEGRCGETGFLEFHHVVPYAAGGGRVAGNIELRCRAHNAFEAELFFGGGTVREVSTVWG